MPERLDKLIASQTKFSRGDVKKLIRSGRILVNGCPASSAEMKIEPSENEVSVDGVLLFYEKFIYIMMNKPEGVVSATEDKRDKTVLDLVPEEYRHRALFPAGRLDKNTTGFVLLTDDGDFAHKILTPKNHITKTYIVTLERTVTQDEHRQICAGMTIGGEQLLPASLTQIHDTVYEIVIREGKYHQIKRMFGSFGNPVTALRRTKMGNLPLDEDLPEGSCRKLSPNEVKMIEDGKI